MSETRIARTGIRGGLLAVSLLLLGVLPAFSQAIPPPADDATQQEGINGAKYNIKSSVELGGRFTDITGNQNVYDTFVNLQQGARLLDFTTEMRALDHT